MSESKGGSSGSSGEGARGPGRGGRKPAGGTRNATTSTRHAATSTRKPADSVPETKAGARKPAKAAGKAKPQAKPKIMPIYARLPRGPHPLGAPGVARNQRIRIHGGMIEAVTTRGYPQASVKLVVGLAGVSRRSFYEQFSGKEDCFMSTFDLIANRAVKRLTDAYRTTEGDQRQRLRAVLQAWGAELEQNPKALRLAIVESQTAGVDGLRRLQKVTAVCEGLLAGALSARCLPAGGKGPEALPPPVVRAIVGGLRRATQMRLLDDDTEDLQPLVREMVKWLLLFEAPASGGLRPRHCANQPFPERLLLEPGACGGESRRARVLRSAIETGLRERKFADLSAPRIAEGAGLPFEAVTELYPDAGACYLEALDVLGDELLQLIASPELVSAQWPAAVCRTIDALLAHLAGSPARLMTLTVKALEAGPAAIANVGDLAYEVATLLSEGAPRRPRTRIAIEGIAGGLWNILYCEALAGRGHRLPLLSEYLSYVVLTPYLGPEEAVAAIAASRATAAPREQPGADPAATAAGNGHSPETKIAGNGHSPETKIAGHGDSAGTRATAGNGAASNCQAATGNGKAPVGESEDYRRLAERRSAKCVNTTPTSTESTITTIKGA
jgi:AcrR family transcriptional regulator